MFAVSSVSEYEFVQLVGHYNFLVNGSKEEIDPRLKSRGYTEAQLSALKKMTKTMKHSHTSQGVIFKRHLSEFKYPLMNYVLMLHENYERGVLPYAGSLSEQPAKVIEIFNLLSNLKHEHQEQVNKAHQKKAEAKNGRRHKN